MADRIWSEQQKAIFEWFGIGHGHLVVRARAGTGKTTTILEAINYAPESSILLAAFNKRIADHLKGELRNPRAEAKTLHSVGFAFIRERWGKDVQVADYGERADDLARQAIKAWQAAMLTTKLPDGATLEQQRAHWLLMDIAESDMPVPVIGLISKLNAKARELVPHATTPDQLQHVVQDNDCVPDEEFEEIGYTTALVVEIALIAMTLGMTKPKPFPDTGYAGGIDYADMIFLPIRNRWLRKQYELVVVDEAQDMAAAQLELAQGICRGRLCVVGDDRQAIYGFRGADSNSIDRLKTVLGATELGLNTTYRCGHSIVRHNQRIVADFNAHHANHEGEIRTLTSYALMVAEANAGDFILSRKNAPLAGVAMALIRINKRVSIAGRDIGKGLEALVKKLSTGAAEHSVPMFLQRLNTWRQREAKRALASARSEAMGIAKCEAIFDKADTLEFLVEGAVSVRSVLVRIHDLFPKREDGKDVNPATVVTCSSIHKAKGLEAQRVYVMMDTLYPHKTLPARILAKIGLSRQREEENLDYVACTRAIRELVLVTDAEAVAKQTPLPWATETPAAMNVFAPFEPQTTEDIDDKADFDALAAAVHEIEGDK